LSSVVPSDGDVERRPMVSIKINDK
jgi:hypothetical protein